jgi:propionyl-CoA carboxylase alpha chain/3-methylcrotonyl-CoA carboxylase alpha subunit
VREADQAVRLGPPPARESYLRQDLILEAARSTGADAIHPGYGFLSENAEFAEAVAAAGLVWVGPPPSAIRAMGLKDAAKKLMAEAGVPVTPGWLGEDQSAANLAAQADAIGCPVLIKAVAGGGGKGMRRVDDPAAFAEALASAQREAASAFGDDRVLLERYLTRPRHIEVQGVRRHARERRPPVRTRLLAAAPAPKGDRRGARARHGRGHARGVCAAAVRAAKAVDYVGAGTVEFIADASEGLRADRIWFMEMNTRLQVEHPVTEMITGLDLVEWQLRVASGEPLPKRQEELRIDGHALEARLYAENPATGFLPSTGPLTHFWLPEADVRVDSAVEQGGEVSVFYDPMIAKLIAHADTREAAAAALADACRAVEVWPVKTNAAFLARCLSDPDFLAADVHTGFISQRQDRLATPPHLSEDTINGALALAAETAHKGPHWNEPWDSDADGLFGFRLNAPPSAPVTMTLGDEQVSGSVVSAGCGDRSWLVSRNGSSHAVAVSADALESGGEVIRHAGLIVGGHARLLFQHGEALLLEEPDYEAHHEADAGSGSIAAPMPGRIIAVHVAAGDAVTKGAKLVTLEAMKMEHGLTAPFDGTVAEVPATEGGQVSEGALLVRLEPKA